MRTVALFVHGVEVPDPLLSIASLAPEFQAAGFDTERYDYDRLPFWASRVGRAQRAAQLLSACRIAVHAGCRVIVVAHSNGACLAMDAAARQDVTGERLFDHLVVMSPALDRDAFIPTSIRRFDCHYTRSDWAVWWARWLFWHPWGDMGRRGYTGRDPVARTFDGTGHVAGHSGWLLPKGRQYVRSAMANRLAAEYGLAPGPPDAPFGFFAARHASSTA